MKLFFSPVNQFYLILLSDQPKILEGEKKMFSFLSLSKSFAKRPLHICYSASTQRAKHGVMLSHISEVERYYRQNNLTPQVLLLLDNALGHLDSLWDWRKKCEHFNFTVKFKFIHPANGPKSYFNFWSLLLYTDFWTGYWWYNSCDFSR